MLPVNRYTFKIFVKQQNAGVAENKYPLDTYIYVKSHLKALKRYEVDLLNKILNIDFGQEASKIPEVKVRGRKKHLPIIPV